jgi:hypothetical protein
MRWLLALLFFVALGTNQVQAQNPTCPTRPFGDSSNACASTAFVAQNALPLALTQNFIIVGSAGNLAVGVPLSGSCTIVSAGAISCNANALTGTTLASGVVGSSLTSVGNPLTIGTSLYPSISGSHFRYDANSALLTNTVGTKVGLFGLPAIDTNVTWVNTYISGADSLGNVTVYGTSPNGVWGSLFASRSSDNPAGTPQNIVGTNSLGVHDSTTAAGHNVWAQYTAGVVTAASTPSHILGHEISIFNNGSVVAEDPFNFNPTGSSEALRVDCALAGAIGANSCGAGIGIVPNGAKLTSGINCANGALDTVVTTNPDCLSIPPVYSITWYNAAAAKTWQLFAGGGANGALNLNTTGTGAFTIGGAFKAAGAFELTAPVTICGGGNTYTVGVTDNYLQSNDAGATCTVTLPAVASFVGRVIKIKNIQAQTVVSAASNVVPLPGGAAGTAILSAVAGRWVEMVSDGGNWVIMAGVP